MRLALVGEGARGRSNGTAPCFLLVRRHRLRCLFCRCLLGGLFFVWCVFSRRLFLGGSLLGRRLFHRLWLFGRRRRLGGYRLRGRRRCFGRTLDRRSVSYTHLRAHETKANLVCRLLLE